MDAAMTKPKNDFPLAFVREALDLDPSTPSGLRWRRRPQWHFPDRSTWAKWNGKHAGAAAGSPSNASWQVRLTFAERTRALWAHRIVYALTHGRWPEHGIDHAKGAEAGNGIAKSS
jgi:hypothetical protein